MASMDRLFDDAVAAFRKELIAAVEGMRESRSPQEFTDSEREVHRLSRRFAAKLTAEVMQAVSDDPSRRKEALARVRERAGARGIDLRVERKRKTPVRTLNGEVVEVVTPYASARPRAGSKREKRGSQGTGVYPVLDQLGISGRNTPALRLLVSRAVCEANSVGSARELLSSAGVDIDHKGALRLAYDICDDALRARRAAIRETTKGNADGAFVGRRVVAAVDGGRINIRKRVAGRPRKGGRKKFETEWREPKILTLYVLDDNGRRDKSIASVIDGTLGDADAVFELLRYHLLRLGAHKAAELVLIGDGAKWIWNRADSLRDGLGLEPDRFTQIVDYFHVVERLGELSQTQAALGEAHRLSWLHLQKRRLKAGNIEEIEGVVRMISKRKPDEMESEAEYWARNRERLRYAAFRERGLPIGSGAVESSVRRVVNLRLKGASITWTEEHAEGILHLRAHAKSGRWTELEHTVLAVTGWRPTARAAPRAA